jgi:tetratricopeptide (TPR) repeat protein
MSRRAKSWRVPDCRAVRDRVFVNTHPQLQLVVSLAQRGQFDEAMTEAARIVDNTTCAEAWRLLSQMNANSQRFVAALAAIENALRQVAGSRSLRLERAQILEQLGRPGEALAELEDLAREARDSPRLALQLARVLQYSGLPDRAEMEVSAALDAWPTDIPLHLLYAQLRWLQGAGEDIVTRLQETIARFPREMPLRLVTADLLRQAGELPRARAVLTEALALAPRSSAVLTSLGVVLDDLGQTAEALQNLRAALVNAPDSVSARTNLAATLLRTGDAREALFHLDRLLANFPDEQRLIAYRATALRVLGEPEYRRLHDYERLVREYHLAPPAGYPDIDSFNREFAREVRALHVSARRPLAQSLRGGSQTDRNLPANLPAVAAFLQCIREPISDYISRLGKEPEHPTDRRKTAGFRVTGTWSVQLSPGGFHLNHVHPQGWLSSAYYIELPDGGEDRAGWLKFGEPGLPMASCPPEHFVRPKAGMLVLFPSYLWHGTVPFDKGGRRLTAAFDVLPD